MIQITNMMNMTTTLALILIPICGLVQYENKENVEIFDQNNVNMKQMGNGHMQNINVAESDIFGDNLFAVDGGIKNNNGNNNSYNSMSSSCSVTSMSHRIHYRLF